MDSVARAEATRVAEATEASTEADAEGAVAVGAGGEANRASHESRGIDM